MESKKLRITQVSAVTIANVIATFWAIVGLGVAIAYSVAGGVDFGAETQSVLKGLAFGITTGFLSILFLPFIYFIFGWIVGIIQGFIISVVVSASRGIEITTEEEELHHGAGLHHTHA